MKRTPLDAWILQKHGIDVNDHAELACYQLKKIQTLVEYARNSSKFYSQLYAEQETPFSLEDFTHFPLISALDLIKHGPSMLCISQREIRRIVTLQTSGTSQKPKRIYFSDEDISLTLDFFQNGMTTLTTPGDRALILFTATTPDSVGALLMAALERLGLTVCHSSVQNAADILPSIDIVAGPVSLLLQIAQANKGIPIRAVLTSSENLTKSIRQQIKDCWGAEVFDHYGMTETGLGGAVECSAHEGMHIRENDLYFETVTHDGKPLPYGQKGELVVTTLTRQGMPFIRYRTGDCGIISDERCRCGSRLRRILEIERNET